ncbi:tyrosine-type recombinase/integrase [Duganella phyllosphaerae]|uniref:tyrosine-type recombinase/integrase n=1 Tax=Duganella phyllosphaerae TaxID=762836 RepID=UPI000873D0AA|nr:integrase family protein [Duganella phyllosphaerae]
MKKIKFAAGRVEEFACEGGNSQSFLWDTASPGLGLRVTSKGAKSYIFQGKLNGATIRLTIGDPRTWDIAKAQAEARRLKVLLDNGQDPRKVRDDALAAVRDARAMQEAAVVAEQEKQLRESVTLGGVWPEYIADRIATREAGWSEHHIVAHRKIIQDGGHPRKRSPALTKAGPLWSLSSLRLIDLTNERVEAWAREEAKTRPSSARLAWRLLKAFMNWCASHKTYSSMVTSNPTKSARVRESLGKEKRRHDVLQREMLQSWFSAVRKIGNPVIAAYLQVLLLTGARREELAALKWTDVNFQWGSIKLSDKVEDFRMVPLTPFVAQLLANLPRRNAFVFSSPASASGHIAEPRIAHNEAVAVANLPQLTLHGLRRSFATLSEWIEMPNGIAAQIQGHAPQGVREQNYIRRPLDLLRVWHAKIETWILKQASVEPVSSPVILRVVGV